VFFLTNEFGRRTLCKFFSSSNKFSMVFTICLCSCEINTTLWNFYVVVAGTTLLPRRCDEIKTASFVCPLNILYTSLS